MEIPLVEDWREKYKPGQARVYPVGQTDRDIIDKAFDKLQGQDRAEWTKTSTPFTFSCFVVWRTMPDGSRKGRVVVDIRALNKITMPDAYPVPSQADILAAIHGAKFITTVDCASFFYQWRDSSVTPRSRDFQSCGNGIPEFSSLCTTNDRPDIKAPTETRQSLC